MANDVKFEGKRKKNAQKSKSALPSMALPASRKRDLCLSKGIDVDKIVRVYSPSRSRTPAGHIPWVAQLL